MKIKVKTIDITALEWFDKVNGNSYFAGTVTVNYGTKSEIMYVMPFQYGYGDSYRQEAAKVLKENGVILPLTSLQLLKESGVIIRYTKHENCKKRELTNL